ncbi:MAG: tetratricopeptide repeat protein [Holophagales bacterium]|nr:tetratricopeptide repeat protein [Holophagales bacterium]
MSPEPSSRRRPIHGLASLRAASLPPLAAVILAACLTPMTRADEPADTRAADPQDGSSQAEAPQAGAPRSGGPPGWLDRLLWNADERTQRGMESLEEKDLGRAAASMETALRLAPDDPRARFNAGTANLPTRPEAAQGLLESASAAGVESTLAAKASYNLGNLHLESDRLSEAIEAYKDALRRDPAFEDAKYNLELAQRRLEERQNQQDQDQQDQDQQDQDQQNQDQQNQDQQNQDQQDQDQQDQDQQNQDQQNQDQQEQDQQQDQNPQQDQQNQAQQEQDQQRQEGGEQGEGQQEESPLPQFEDLPEMNAEEAAAILEAIENMEREQRRQRALEAAKAQVGKKKDW